MYELSKMRKTAIILVICFLQAKAFHLNRIHVQQRSSRANPLHSDVTEGDRPPKSRRKDEEVSKFLTDFRTAQGNLVNPCKKIPIVINRVRKYVYVVT